MQPSPINPEAITTEAQKAAFMYDTVLQACPYPFGSLAERVFSMAFEAAKKAMAESYAPPPKVASPKHDRLSGTYTPSTDTYCRNYGNSHIPSRGVGC